MTPSAAQRRPGPPLVLRGLRTGAALLGSLVLFYGLRALGVSAYLALLAGTAASVLGTAVDVVRRRTIGPVTAFVVALMIFSTGVSLLNGDVRFLLARGAWVTGLSGAWFLASAFTRHSLVYLFSRPLLEGRFGWPADWDAVWERVPRFRRVWRVTGVMWGLALMLDCVLRVLMAYTLPVDSVPAASTALSALTTLALITAANIYYQVTGAARKWSRFYASPKPGGSVPF